MRLDLLYTLAININIRPILHGISSHVLHHFGWGWVGVGRGGVGWGGVGWGEYDIHFEFDVFWICFGEFTQI